MITSSGNAAGQVGVPFSYQITATNSPTGFAASGLPAGLSVSPETGLISGTPAAASACSVTLRASNKSGTGTKTLALTIIPAKPLVTSPGSASGQVGVKFGYQIVASNRPTSFDAEGLPPGLNVNRSTGLISGLPSVPGESAVRISAANAGGTSTAALALTILPARPVITSATAAAGQVGVAFTYQIAATNRPTSFGATGLPAGLAVNSVTGLVSGIPVTAGTATVTIAAANAGGAGTRTLTLKVAPASAMITSGNAATGQVGTAFFYQITANNHPVRFSASGLPSGVSVNPATGVIAGTPTTAGTSNAMVTSTGASGAVSAVVVMTILPPAPVIGGATLAAGKAGTEFLHQVVASNTPVRFAATGLPPGLQIDPATGLISGVPLLPGMATVVLTATNAGGTGSQTLVLTIVATLPYLADFEVASGYTPGSAGGQLGWLVPEGSGEISTQSAYTGRSSLSLAAGISRSLVTQTFAANAGSAIVFVDLFATPVAEPDPGRGTVFTADQATFAFKRNGAVGTLVLSAGPGGDGNWTATGCSIPLGADGAALSWLRLTVRLDYQARTWDLYADGRMVAAEIPLAGASLALSTFQLRGAAAAASYVDDFFAGAINPLFADANNNGIDDAWETAHGLSLASDNRHLTPGGGTTVIQAYLNGTDPNDYYNGAAPTLTILGGNNQTAAASRFNPAPFDVGVWTSTGALPLANAPVTFRVQGGGGQLALSNNGHPPLANSLNVYTDANGTVQVYFQQPPFANVVSNVEVAAGAARLLLVSTSSGASGDPGDTDSNGLPDAWELLYFGRTGADPRADPDGDGLTNLQEAQAGSNPFDFYNGQAPFPLLVDFEASEGFFAGALNGRKGWVTSPGVEIGAAAAASGLLGVAVPASEPAGRVDFTFSVPPPGDGIIFAYAFVRPVAGTNPDDGIAFDLAGARVACVRNGTGGELHVFDGVGKGSGQWRQIKAGFSISVDATTGVADWTPQFGVRFDLSRKRWDLQVDGEVVAVDVGLADNGATVSHFTLFGKPGQPVWFDRLFVGAENLAFTDADRDDMDDAWERRRGLDPGRDDRDADPDGDGLANIVEALLNLRPDVADTDGDGLPDAWEYAHGFDPAAVDSAYDSDGDGKSALEEYRAGTDLNDYYNGVKPTLTIEVGADGQPGPDGLLAVRVTDPDGVPLVNAPVRFTAGEAGRLATTPRSTIYYDSFEARTDEGGVARIYYRQP